MKSSDEHSLRRRLARVEALHRGATTSGEREAAARARDRLLDRIAVVRENDPVARFCAEHVAELGVPPEPPPPPARLPERAELLAVLDLWASGHWSRHEVHAWATSVVDRVVIPDETESAAAVVAEVLLQLAALHHVPLVAEDLPRVRAFLLHGDWGAWFGLIEEAARRFRRATG